MMDDLKSQYFMIKGMMADISPDLRAEIETVKNAIVRLVKAAGDVGTVSLSLAICEMQKEEMEKPAEFKPLDKLPPIPKVRW